MMKTILCVIFFYYSLTPLFPQNRITLDNAIADFAEYAISQLPTSNRRIAVIAFETNKRDLMIYGIDTLLEKILEKGTGLVIVERQRIENLQRELNFSLTGYVSDETAQRIGHFIGANTVIYGSLTTSGNLSLLTLRATDVETSQILATKSYDLRTDSKLRGLLGETIKKVTGNEVYYKTLGASIGTSFAEPWFIGTIQGTLSPFRYSFIEIGLDLNLISGIPDVLKYYTVFPFVHYSGFIPFGTGGIYAGAGIGYMFGERTYQDWKDYIRIITADFKAGWNIINGFDISYTLRTNFKSINNKFSVGYTYRFNP